MGWGDVIGALGAAAGGINQSYQLERERQSREKMNSLTNEIRQMIADAGNRNRIDVQGMKDEAAFKRAQLKADTDEKITNLITNRVINVESLKSDTAKELRRMLDENNIDVETYRAAVQYRKQDIDKLIAEGHDRTSSENNQRTTDAQRYVADKNASSREAVAKTNQEGQNFRQQQRLPLDIYRNQNRAQNAPGRRAGRRGAMAPTQSFSDFMAGYRDQANTKLPSGDIQLGDTNKSPDFYGPNHAQAGPGMAGPMARPSTQAGALPPGPGMMSAFLSDAPIDFGSVQSEFGEPPSPSFSASGSMPPFEPPAAPVGAGMPPPSPVMAPSPVLDRSLGAIPTMPTTVLGAPGVTMGRGIEMPPAPPMGYGMTKTEQTTTSPTPSSDARKMQQVQQLIDKYMQARQAGQFEQMRSIEQQIRDMTKQ